MPPAVLSVDSQSNSDLNVTIGRTACTFPAFAAWRLVIPSERALLTVPIGVVDASQQDKFADTILGIEFGCVSEVRRWDPDSDDPRIQRVVAALESVPPGTNLESTSEERDRADE